MTGSLKLMYRIPQHSRSAVHSLFGVPELCWQVDGASAAVNEVGYTASVVRDEV